MDGHVYLASLLLVGMFSFFLGTASWKKRDVSGARWLAALLVSISFWTFMQAAMLLTESFAYKLLLHNLMFGAICLIPLSILFFVLDYYHLLKYLSPTIQRALFIIPLLTVFIIATDQRHHLFYRSVRLLEVGSYTFISGTFNLWFRIHSAYSYLLILGAVVILVYELRSESGAYRRQSLLLLMAIFLSSLVNLATLSKWVNLAVDFTPFSFILIASVFYHSIYHTQVFEVGPITKELLYDTIYDGLMIVNSTGFILEHNRCFLELFKTNPGRIIGKSAVELFNAMGYPGAAVLNTIYSPICIFTESHGTLKSWQITATPLKSQDKLISSMLYLFRDVSEIERSVTEANHSLKNAEKARESITRNLSDMSHEIRTPLMGILGAAHQLKADASDEEQESDAAHILIGAECLLETVNRILDFSKLEAGKMNRNDEVFPIESYFNFLDSSAHPEILRTVSGSLSGYRYFRGDHAHMLQLFQLVHSFLKGSGTELVRMVLGYDEGKLTQHLHFQVPMQEARELLEHWNHLEDYLTRAWRPDPMILLLAQKLVKFIGATAQLEHLDREWTLRLHIPLEAVSDAAFLPNYSPDEAIRSYKLLFAEDSIINQAVIKRMLKTLPWDIIFASNGIEALELAQREVYDGIFTDVHMPGLGGIELSYSLQETINSSTPVFALTSDTDAELQEAVDQSPIRALLVKPCPKEKLIQLLQENPRTLTYND